ncbi:Bro-N domain-containing protein [Streptomyces sp. NPDC005808]|uniref:BRO-N domain-containing protein n=1 Tax=Streptomyces sp. NPDC005808 TaxID=3364734 RepID=UPI00367A78CA
MSEHDTTSTTAPRTEAIDINDFVYGATGARVRRLTMPDGSHWFPAADVCKRLGYTTTRKALLDHVPEAHRDFLETVTGSHSLSVPAGREWRRDLQLIDLSGLIQLVTGCTKPSCRPFKEWVSEVIMSVQRDGSYTLPTAEVQPRDPDGPVAYAMPAQVADAIVRLEERNVRLDGEFAEAQRASERVQSRMADAMDRIADALEAFRPVRAERLAAPAHTYRPSADALLADWRSRMSVTEDVWAVAVTIAPVLAEHGEIRMSLETLSERTGLNAHRVNECLRFMRRHACIRSRGGAEDGTLVYVLDRP